MGSLQPEGIAVILGVDHIGVAVSDLDAAVRLYRDVLGFADEGREILVEMRLEIAFLSARGTRFELLHPLPGEAVISGFLAKKGGGIHHICLDVADIAEALSVCRENGIEPVNPIPRPGGRGRLVAFLHPRSTGGVLLELSQRTSSGGGTG